MTRNGPSKEDYLRFNLARVKAFTGIARKLGKDHEITRRMGSLAWGRSNAEQGPQPTLRSVTEEFGYLNGFFDALNIWARDNDPKAQRVMLSVWPSGYRDGSL